MGRDKLSLPYGGSTLLARRVSEFTACFPLVYLSVAAENAYSEIDCARVVDEVRNLGPMGALYSALRQLPDAPGLMLCAGDMPYAGAEAARDLLKFAEARDYDAVWAEPTFAYYAKSVLPLVEARIAAGNYKLRSLFPELNSARFELPKHALFNVNTPEDYARLS
jgi:molybdopterin-guanine dinucleotide biosynthesis protein A